MTKWSLPLSVVLFSLFAVGFLNAKEPSHAIRRIPVQDAGRIKPFDTFAREALRLVYGKETYNHRTASDIVMTWLVVPEIWDDEKIFQVRHNGLRVALKLASDKEVYRSARELMSNERLVLLIQELRTRRNSKEKLDPYFQAVQTLENQLTLFTAIRSGHAVRFVPPPPTNVDTSDPHQAVRASTWQSVAELSGETRKAYEDLREAYIQAVAKYTKNKSAPELDTLDQAASNLIAKAQAVNPAAYADLDQIELEVFYNHFHPFMWAWTAYLLGAIFLVANWLGSGRKLFYQLSWVGIVTGVILQLIGMGIRTYLTGRPPVSNMYETMIWVPFVAVLCAMVIELIYRTRIVLLASTLVAILCLILSDLAPAVLDDSLHPLEPVLRDNFWLTTHVLIIVASYGAFFLAFALGDLVLISFLRDEKRFAKRISDGVNGIYRSMQVGVVLLAAGTILGGVWADYSWGRFWGWDPKETWALIALLGYVAVLHGRLVGWVRQFGMAVCAVVAFSLVIMAWYGVNFVLGAGLHTYGFGAGGVEYVSAFVAVHLLFVVYVATVRYSRKNEQKLKSSSAG